MDSLNFSEELDKDFLEEDSKIIIQSPRQVIINNYNGVTPPDIQQPPYEEEDFEEDTDIPEEECECEEGDEECDCGESLPEESEEGLEGEELDPNNLPPEEFPEEINTSEEEDGLPESEVDDGDPGEEIYDDEDVPSEEPIDPNAPPIEGDEELPYDDEQNLNNPDQSFDDYSEDDSGVNYDEVPENEVDPNSEQLPYEDEVDVVNPEDEELQANPSEFDDENMEQNPYESEESLDNDFEEQLPYEDEVVEDPFAPPNVDDSIPQDIDQAPENMDAEMELPYEDEIGAEDQLPFDPNANSNMDPNDPNNIPPEDGEIPYEDEPLENPNQQLGPDGEPVGQAPPPPMDPNMDPNAMGGIPPVAPPKTPDDFRRNSNLKNIHKRLSGLRKILDSESKPDFLKIKRKISDSFEFFDLVIKNPDTYEIQMDDIIKKFLTFIKLSVDEIDRLKQISEAEDVNKLKQSNKILAKEDKPKANISDDEYYEDEQTRKYK